MSKIHRTRNDDGSETIALTDDDGNTTLVGRAYGPVTVIEEVHTNDDFIVGG